MGINFNRQKKLELLSRWFSFIIAGFADVNHFLKSTDFYTKIIDLNQSVFKVKEETLSYIIAF